MTIYLGTDHAGFELKEKVKTFLSAKGYRVEDCGAFSYSEHDDYPDTISPAVDNVSKNPQDLGIIFGSSGQGEAIVANKYPNVRAVVFYGPYTPQSSIDVTGQTSTDPFEIVKLTRVHNNANILSVGAHITNPEDALKAIELFIQTPFSNEERHTRRVQKIRDLEKHV